MVNPISLRICSAGDGQIGHGGQMQGTGGCTKSTALGLQTWKLGSKPTYMIPKTIIGKYQIHIKTLKNWLEIKNITWILAGRIFLGGGGTYLEPGCSHFPICPAPAGTFWSLFALHLKDSIDTLAKLIVWHLLQDMALNFQIGSSLKRRFMIPTHLISWKMVFLLYGQEGGT